MKAKKKTKEVMIITLNDLVNAATPENKERLMNDLALWLWSMLTVKTLGLEVKEAAMKWTDDGKNELMGYDIRIRKPR